MHTILQVTLLKPKKYPTDILFPWLNWKNTVTYYLYPITIIKTNKADTGWQCKLALFLLQTYSMGLDHSCSGIIKLINYSTNHADRQNDITIIWHFNIPSDWQYESSSISKTVSSACKKHHPTPWKEFTGLNHLQSRTLTMQIQHHFQCSQITLPSPLKKEHGQHCKSGKFLLCTSMWQSVKFKTIFSVSNSVTQPPE
jgi:hypothetical protein